jgi:signal transduction histidine kinase
MKNLFKPFFTTKTIGSGLGLYTAKGIIENLGGHIVVSCERDKGCSVTVKIPILSKEVIDEQNLSSR